MLEEIDYEQLQHKNRHYVEIKVDQDRKASVLLEQQLGLHDYRIEEAGVLRVYERLDESALMNRTLVQGNVEVREITLMKDTLEDYFLRLIGGGERG